MAFLKVLAFSIRAFCLIAFACPQLLYSSSYYINLDYSLGIVMVKFRNHGCKDLNNLSRKFSVVHISLPRNFELSVFACSFRSVALAHLNSKEDVARTRKCYFRGTYTYSLC